MIRFASFVIVVALGLITPALADAPPVYPVNQAMHDVAVTPSNSTPLAGGATLGIYNGNSTACNIAFVLAKDFPQSSASSVVWQNIPSGSLLPVRATFVLSTGTTCSNIVAIY